MQKQESLVVFCKIGDPDKIYKKESVLESLIKKVVGWLKGDSDTGVSL